MNCSQIAIKLSGEDSASEPEKQQFDSALTAYYTLYNPNELYRSPININLLQEIMQKRYDQDIEFKKKCYKKQLAIL